MTAHLHLLQLNIRPNAYISDVISGCGRMLQEAAAATPGRVIHSYKVDGENKLIFVIDGSVDDLMREVISSYGEQIECVCLPVRSYVSFAEQVLGVDNVSGGTGWNPEGKLFWVVIELEYAGKELSEFLEILKKEAEFVVSMVKGGKVDGYKTVAKRQIHMFASMHSCDLLDNVLFTLPIVKALGHQVHITAHSLLPIKH